MTIIRVKSYYTLMIICVIFSFPVHAAITNLSISDNGKYVISNSRDRKLIMWDISKRKTTLLDTDANIYSGKFSTLSDNYRWQGMDNIVRIYDLLNRSITRFKSDPVYSSIYVPKNNLFAFYRKNGDLVFLENGKLKKIFNDGTPAVFKLPEILATNNQKYLITSSICGTNDKTKPISDSAKLHFKDCVIQWDIDSQKPIFAFGGNAGKTTVAISPDNKYLVAGDEAYRAYLWSLSEKWKLFELLDTRFIHKTIINKKSSHVDVPKDFARYALSMQGIIAFRFIDNDHYLEFVKQTPYAVLFDTKHPYPLKYLYLGKKSFPGLLTYADAQTIATSPKAHILVMPNVEEDGINVYRYDPKTQTIDLIWAPKETIPHAEVTRVNRRTWQSLFSHLWHDGFDAVI